MAKRLGSISGVGTLTGGGRDLGDVTYEIVVFGGDNDQHASGTIFGSAQALWEAFERGSARLELEQGGLVTVILSSIDTDRARVEVGGPIPGF